MAKHHNEVSQRYSASHAPGSALLLGKYEQWLPAYQKVFALRAEKEKLSAYIRELRRAPFTPEDLIDHTEQQYEEHRQKRSSFIQRHFHEAARSGATPNLINFLFYHSATADLLPLPPFEEVKAAIKSMPKVEGALSRAEVAKRISKAREKIEAIEKEIAKLSPPEFFVLPDGRRSDKDLRDALVEHWAKAQSKACAPCNPLLITLEKSSESEKNAWKALGLKNFIGKRDDAPLPHPGD